MHCKQLKKLWKYTGSRIIIISFIYFSLEVKRGKFLNKILVMCEVFAHFQALLISRTDKEITLKLSSKKFIYTQNFMIQYTARLIHHNSFLTYFCKKRLWRFSIKFISLDPYRSGSQSLFSSDELAKIKTESDYL